jgi:branched-chain amino acid transport system substrate-binding protein
MKNRGKASLVIMAITAIVIGSFIAYFAGVSYKHETVKIGFAGGLTGRIADVGIAGRDGAILAVEEQNLKGGINGRPIELIIKDDRQNVDTAIKIDKEFIDAGVIAIIGHMTSSMSVKAVEVINNSDIIMISPTTSTNDLTGIDDNFLRVYPYSAQTSRLLAEHTYNKMNLKKTIVVYDITNRAHTESAYIQFKQRYESLGGTIADNITFLSGGDVSFSSIAKDIIAQKPDCLYLLANAMNSAMLCQQLQKLKHKLPIIASDWSATDEVIKLGGNSVDGLFFLHTVNKYSEEPAYKKFQNDFTVRFGRNPDFVSVHAFDSARILFQALEKNSNPELLKQTILDIGTFQGLQTEIKFDKFGDVTREHFPFIIKQGRFEAVKLE